jgi:hypothetical protein
MARTDKPIVAKVPGFVHSKMDELVDALEAEGASATSLVGALVMAASESGARLALRAYKRRETAERRARRADAMQSRAS